MEAWRGVRLAPIYISHPPCCGWPRFFMCELGIIVRAKGDMDGRGSGTVTSTNRSWKWRQLREGPIGFSLPFFSLITELPPHFHPFPLIISNTCFCISSALQFSLRGNLAIWLSHILSWSLCAQCRLRVNDNALWFAGYLQSWRERVNEARRQLVEKEEIQSSPFFLMPFAV